MNDVSRNQLFLPQTIQKVHIFVNHNGRRYIQCNFESLLDKRNMNCPLKVLLCREQIKWSYRHQLPLMQSASPFFAMKGGLQQEVSNTSCQIHFLCSLRDVTIFGNDSALVTICFGLHLFHICIKKKNRVTHCGYTHERATVQAETMVHVCTKELE